MSHSAHYRSPSSAAPIGSDAAAANVIETSTLAGGLAHEIRNSLSTLRMNLQLLEEDWRALETGSAAVVSPAQDVSRRSRMRLDSLVKETQRLERILEDFLEFVQHRELHAAPCDLNELVCELADFYRPQAEAHGVELEIIPANRPIIACVDAALIKQALLNLMINAQQAMPDGGRLVIRIIADSSDSSRIDVVDTGSGISVENLPQVFNPYFSTRKGGTGLGLPMARRIARAHDGDLNVSSQAAGGTTFSLVLPRLAEAS